MKYTADDIVHLGDKIRVSGTCFSPEGKLHILAQVQSNLFSLIDLESGNRLCDPFPCKYGIRLRSEHITSDEIEMYGSFSLADLHDAVASQSHEEKFIGERMADTYQFKIEKRFCHPHVFEKLAKLWDKKAAIKFKFHDNFITNKEQGAHS